MTAPDPPHTTPENAAPGQTTPVNDASGQTPSASAPRFVVVGIGASAGGLEAVSQLLRGIHGPPGAALVLLQHLSAGHKSNLTEILARTSPLEVVEVTDGLELRPDRLHVAPPGHELGVRGPESGVSGLELELLPRRGGQERYLPIDHFFSSLAEAVGPLAVGVILSGTGSDGTLGLRAIKAAGGITLVQDPATARYSGMPGSARAGRDVDLVLPPEGIAEELTRIARHVIPDHPPATSPTGGRSTADPSMHRILALLRRRFGVDFSAYKPTTVERRLRRRMVLSRVGRLEDYRHRLEADADEADLLFDDMLINVTSFFRDPDAFESLRSRALATLVEATPPGVPIRIWVPGCSTGEEAYSIAILLVELLDERHRSAPVQIFATDVSETSVSQARSGCYPGAAAEQLGAMRLQRHFTRDGEVYRISRRIRDMCIFARHDLTRDPPFSRLDLISCRNLLIYMGAALQERIMPLFHYALAPDRYLFLGSSESIGGFADLFALADRKHRIYVRKSASPRLPASALPGRLGMADPGEQGGGGMSREPDLQAAADRVVLAHYGPRGVVVDGRLEIVQFRGQTDRYLVPAPGRAGFNLLKMARPGVLAPLRTAIHEARERGETVRVEGVRVDGEGDGPESDIIVTPLADLEPLHLLVLFEERGRHAGASHAAEVPTAPPGSTAAASSHAGGELDRQRLQDELLATREALQTVIDDHAAHAEELRVANEEIVSSNEELQSTNEELETAKEELQSTNEELTTLNEELENRNAELCRAADDLNNLLNSVGIPILILGPDLAIRSFTSLARQVLSLRQGDIGRPVGELNLGIAIPSLEEVAREVLETLGTREMEVWSNDHKRCHVVRIGPYRTSDDRIDGVVISAMDATRSKMAEDAETLAIGLLQSVVDSVRDSLVVLDHEFRVVMASRRFYELFDTARRSIEGRSLFELGEKRWDVPELRERLERVQAGRTSFDDFEIEIDVPRAGCRRLVLNARTINGPHGLNNRILLAIEETRNDELGSA